MGGCLYQVFKIVVIILTLINIGTGYTKFYQLIETITGTIGDAGTTESFADLVWIPFLVVQILSTLFQFIQLYCLFRELCEDSFMYRHCFKCCFILIVLIYVLSAIPKSVLTIVYHKSESSIQTWWKVVIDFFDSLLAGVTALGFQIILFIPVFEKTLRSAGLCRSKIWPSGRKSDSKQCNPDNEHTPEPAHGNAFCLFDCCKSTKDSSKDASVEMTDEKLTAANSNSTANTLGTKARHIKDTSIEIKYPLENEKARLGTEIKNKKEEKVKHLEQTLAERKSRLLSKMTKLNVNDDNELPKLETEQKSIGGNKPEDKTGIEIGITNDIKADNELPKVKRLWTMCKSVTCGYLENRTRCFIISLALANFHLFVYIVEVVFIFCFIC